MAKRITPRDCVVGIGQNAEMERSIAISAATAGSTMLLVDRDDGAGREDAHPPPRPLRDEHLHRLRPGTVHVGGDRSRAGDGGRDRTSCIPAGEIHVEENASTAEPLVVVLSRNCPDSHVVYVDEGPDGSGDVPAPC